MAGVRRLSPHFVLVTLAGADLCHAATHREDQRVKLIFPAAGGLMDVGNTEAESADWYDAWRATPAARRGHLRTYTVRDVRPQDGELDVVMVRHGGGAACRWLDRAAVGDELILIGPDARSSGSGTGRDWEPGTATELLLGGDETAAPAICSILEGLPAGGRATAFVEVPTAADILPFAPGSGVHLTWLPREGAAYGHRLVPAIEDWMRVNSAAIEPSRATAPQSLAEVDVDTELLWDSPAVRVAPEDHCVRGERCGSDFYGWFAGEAAVIRALRRTLVTEVGVCRRRVAFMGYWRSGRVAAQ